MSNQMEVVTVIRPADPRWRAHLAKVPHDCYHLPEYVQFAAEHEQGEPLAFYMESGDSSCLVPLLRRTLPGRLGAPLEWSDLSSPYGYSSPLCFPPNSATALAQGMSTLKQWGKDNNVVTIFLRLHPLLTLPVEGMFGLGHLVDCGQTVLIDLGLSNEEIWRNTRKNHRHGIRNLLQKGFRIVFNDWQYLHDFAAMYRQTMKRVRAREFYHFMNGYFEGLFETLNEKLVLVCVLAPNGDLASGGLFIAYRDFIQFHLAGTHDDYLEHAPGKLIFDFVTRWGKDRGYRYFHLGGGVGASDDQLFHYKAGFSDLRREFHTFRMVVDNQKYEFLNQRYLDNFSDGTEKLRQYFPLYRVPSF